MEFKFKEKITNYIEGLQGLFAFRKNLLEYQYPYFC